MFLLFSLLLNVSSRLYSGAHNFDRFYSGLSYYSSLHYCDYHFDNFVDDNLADFDESVNFFNFSVDNAPHVSLSQPFEALHQEILGVATMDILINNREYVHIEEVLINQIGCILCIIPLIFLVGPIHP